LLAPACSGTGDGGTGDTPSDPSADVLGSGDRLHELLGPAPWVNEEDVLSEACVVPGERPVHVTGLSIVAIDRFDETGAGQRGNFYVQDGVDHPTEFSGVTVFDPSFSPPDLRLEPGDSADLNGMLMEFLGPSTGAFGSCKTLPEIGGTMSFRFDRGTIVPTTIPIADLASYDTARRWLGMLVRVENVTIAATGENKGGRYTAPIAAPGGTPPSIANELYDIEAEGPALEQDTTFRAVTGVVTYFYAFKLVPRSPADFEP
jgi:hypothetical protein